MTQVYQEKTYYLTISEVNRQPFRYTYLETAARESCRFCIYANLKRKYTTRRGANVNRDIKVWFRDLCCNKNSDRNLFVYRQSSVLSFITIVALISRCYGDILLLGERQCNKLYSFTEVNAFLLQRQNVILLNALFLIKYFLFFCNLSNRD